MANGSEGIVAAYRGTILHAMAWVERSLDEIISFHFVGKNTKKQVEFVHVMLGTASCTMDSKFKILKYLLTSIYSDFSLKNPTLSTQLKNCIQIRNAYAHRHFFPDKYEKEPTDENWRLYHFQTDGNILGDSFTPTSRKHYDAYLKNIYDLQLTLDELSLLQKKG
jgi:hypothetical protein